MVRVLYLIENGSYRYDRRARREVCTLRDAGCKVVVICPAFEDEGLKETMDGNVEVYRYRYPSFGKGFFGHLGEYGASLSCMSALMAYIHAKHGFDVIHAVNPPDLLWTLVAPYNDLEAVRTLFSAHGGDVACVFVEPVAGNMGCVLPEPGFLEGLRAECDRHGALLVFDEVNESSRFTAMQPTTSLQRMLSARQV